MNGVSIHHIYFPRRDYQTRTEKTFRNLPCHKVEMSTEGHRQLHQLAFRDNGVIPDKPTPEQMVEKINFCMNVCKRSCNDEGN